MRPKILITGAAGFIGSFMTKYFESDFELYLVDSLEFGGKKENLSKNQREKLLIKNCADLTINDFQGHKIDYCIHLAGISSLPENEIDYPRAIANNFNSTVNLFDLSIKLGVSKFLFASTSAVYENTQTLPFFEESKVEPDLMYSYSKRLCEEYLQFRSSKLDFIETHILRFFNVFGPNQNSERKNPPLTSYLVDCIKNKKTAILYNDQTSIKRDYIHVEDIYKIISTLIKKENSSKKLNTWNLTSGNAYSVKDIIHIIEEVHNRTLDFNFNKPDEIWSKYPTIIEKISKDRIQKEVHKHSLGDNSRVLELIGKNYQFIDMKEGIKRLYNEQ